ncbi:MAG: cytochrome c oxidase assembly protein [Caldimonas sp.]
MAHASDADFSTWHSHWSFEPWVVCLLAVSATLYAAGVVKLWRHAGHGRGITRAQAAAFAAGWLFLVVALVSPVDALGGQLFSAHMVQHETLMLLAAPMLVLGRPLAAWAWALPMTWRRGVGAFFHSRGWRVPWRIVTGALAAWLLHAAALWLWHLPALFEAALANEAIHTFQHLTFLFTALLFWWSVLGATTRRDRGIALVSLFTTFVHTGALGALLTLARTDWYPSYAATAPAFHLTPLQDQQIGGLIMWIPAGAIYLVSGLFLAARWMAPATRRRAYSAAASRRPGLLAEAVRHADPHAPRRSE